ncbi:hypothetical protein GCM10009687_51650 [Asanoa iriomotensis]
MQRAGMVLLDHEAIVAAGLGRRLGHRLGGAPRVTLTAVFLQPVGHDDIVRDGPPPRTAGFGHANLMDG